MKHTATSSEISQQMYNFISHYPVGVLSLADHFDQPHASVIYFKLHKDFSVTFTTKMDTKKHAILQHNGHAMLVVYEPMSQTTVQITGECTQITDAKRKEAAFNDMMEASLQTSEEGIPPIFKLNAGPYVAYTLTPRHISMGVFARPEPGDIGTFYETLDFT